MRSKPTLNNFFLVVFVTGILVCDGIAAYCRIFFPLTLVVYLLWVLSFLIVTRWTRKELKKRNAENK